MFDVELDGTALPEELLGTPGRVSESGVIALRARTPSEATEVQLGARAVMRKEESPAREAWSSMNSTKRANMIGKKPKPRPAVIPANGPARNCPRWWSGAGSSAGVSLVTSLPGAGDGRQLRLAGRSLQGCRMPMRIGS